MNSPKAPTPEEIRAAYEAIARDGTEVDLALALAQFAAADPILEGFAARIVAGVGSEFEGCNAMLLRVSLMGSIIYGLNLGLRIGQERNADLLEALKAILADFKEAYDRNPEATSEWREEIAPESWTNSLRLANIAIAKAEERS